MDKETVKRYLEKDGGQNSVTIDGLPSRFLEPLVLQDLRIDLVEPGRIVCYMKVPQRLLNTGNFLHGGATATLVDLVGSAVLYTVGAPNPGVSVEINVSYMDAAYLGEEIQIEAKSLRVGKAIGVVSVELRKKTTGRIIAEGRHTKYLALPSKL